MPASLVMVGQYSYTPANDSTDQDLLDFGRTWSKQVNSCASDGCVVTFNSFGDFINKLKGHAPIDKLGILMHSAENTLSFPAPDPQNQTLHIMVPKSLDEVAQALGSQAPAVNEVVFLGCRVGKDPEAIWDFLDALGWKSAVAHTLLHAFTPQNIPLSDEDTDETLTERLDWKLQYLVQNTQFSLDAIPRPKSVQVFIEFFIRRPGGDIEKLGKLERSAAYPRRLAADIEPVSTRAKATELKAKYRYMDMAPILIEIQITMPVTPP